MQLWEVASAYREYTYLFEYSGQKWRLLFRCPVSNATTVSETPRIYVLIGSTPGRRHAGCRGSIYTRPTSRFKKFMSSPTPACKNKVCAVLCGMTLALLSVAGASKEAPPEIAARAQIAAANLADAVVVDCQLPGR